MCLALLLKQDIQDRHLPLDLQPVLAGGLQFLLRLLDGCLGLVQSLLYLGYVANRVQPQGQLEFGSWHRGQPRIRLP